jgi:hypothetical protein
MPKENETTRICARVDPVLRDRFNQIPWGLRAAVLRKVAEWIVSLYEQHGDLALGILISGEFQLTNAVGEALKARQKPEAS